MEHYYRYKVIEVDRCYCASDFQCRIDEYCRRGMRLVSVMKENDYNGVCFLVFEEQVY